MHRKSRPATIVAIGLAISGLAMAAAALAPVPTAEAHPAPTARESSQASQLEKARARITRQQTAIASRNATIERLRSAPPRTVTVNVPGPVITVPSPPVIIPGPAPACPIPEGTLQAVAGMNVSQAWTLMPTLNAIFEAAEAAQSWNAYPSYSAFRSNSTFETITSESFLFDQTWMR